MSLFIKQKQTQDKENELWLPKGKGQGEGYIRVLVLTDTNLYIKQIKNKDLLYSTGNYFHYLAIAYNGLESINQHIYLNMYIYLNHFAVHLKLTNTVNPIFQIKK